MKTKTDNLTKTKIAIAGEKIDPNTPEKEVRRNLYFTNMNKLNLIFKSSILSLAFLCFSAPVNAFQLNPIEKTANMKRAKIKVDITITSKEGCKFRVKGEVEYSIWNGFESFTGTITASGGDGCPTGTWVFGMATNPNNDGYIFYGENPFVKILKDEPKTLSKLVKEFESYFK